MTMTPEERDEWTVSYWTRLGDLCPAGTPTQEQVDMARAEADQHVLDCRAAGVFKNQ